MFSIKKDKEHAPDNYKWKDLNEIVKIISNEIINIAKFQVKEIQHNSYSQCIIKNKDDDVSDKLEENVFTKIIEILEDYGEKEKIQYSYIEIPRNVTYYKSQNIYQYLHKYLVFVPKELIGIIFDYCWDFRILFNYVGVDYQGLNNVCVTKQYIIETEYISAYVRYKTHMSYSKRNNFFPCKIEISNIKKIKYNTLKGEHMIAETVTEADNKIINNVLEEEDKMFSNSFESIIICSDDLQKFIEDLKRFKRNQVIQRNQVIHGNKYIIVHNNDKMNCVSRGFAKWCNDGIATINKDLENNKINDQCNIITPNKDTFTSVVIQMSKIKKFVRELKKLVSILNNFIPKTKYSYEVLRSVCTYSIMEEVD